MALIKQDFGSVGGGKVIYSDYVCPYQAKTITLDFTPTLVMFVAAHSMSAYNPVIQKWENGTYYYATGDVWNGRDTNPISYTSHSSSLVNDFSVSGNQITIGDASNRTSYWIYAE